MWAKITKRQGFTIVELLIVIVVIGVLAAITIVAYNGIQTRAENTKTLNGVSGYAKVFSVYAADTGAYPLVTGYPCLGTPTANTCAQITTGTVGCAYSGPTNVVAAFDNLLIPYIGSNKPSISDQTMSCGTGYVYRGAYINPNSTDTSTLQIVYHLKGDQPCVAVAGTIIQRQQSGETTRCVLRMPSV